MRKGDILICKENVNNIFGMPLFEKEKEYEVLYVNNERVEVLITLNHNLYANEYMEYPIEWVLEKFKKKTK
jgi:hypothetical protein